jgi:hypothetical protein
LIGVVEFLKNDTPAGQGTEQFLKMILLLVRVQDRDFEPHVAGLAAAWHFFLFSYR